MKFYIAVQEMRSTVVEVEANNQDEAIAKAEKAYYNDDICLDSAEYVDEGSACFYDESDDWSSCVEGGYETRFQKI